MTRPPHELIIRRATVADAARLSRFAADIFRETFGPDNRAEDLDAYLAEAFTPERQASEIADPTGVVLLVEDPSAEIALRLVGYAQMGSGPAPAAISGAAPLELKRFYVAHAWQGRGLARLLMNAVLDAARARGARTLWLGVWERNARAAAFYEKQGFRRVGEHAFVLGSDRQTDWLLARPVAQQLPDPEAIG